MQRHQLLDQAAESHILLGFQRLQGGGIHNILGQAVPDCVTTLCVKNVLPISSLNLPFLSLKPSPLDLSLSALANSCPPPSRPTCVLWSQESNTIKIRDPPNTCVGFILPRFC